MNFKYTKLERSTLFVLQQFFSIANSMKKELIELLGELMHRENYNRDFELECQMMQLLLNPKVTSFIFPRGLKSDDQNAATELWQSLLEEQPPELHTMILSRCNWNKRQGDNHLYAGREITRPPQLPSRCAAAWPTHNNNTELTALCPAADDSNTPATLFMLSLPYSMK
jgi:hypothetical protein